MKQKIGIFAFCMVLTIIFAACSSGGGGKSSSSSSGQSTSSGTQSSSSTSSESEAAKPLTEEQAKEQLEAMLPGAGKIISIFSGEGLKYEIPKDSKVDADGHQWVPVTDPQINSIEKIRQETELYYTEGYAQEAFYQYGLEGLYPRYRAEDGKLLIDIVQSGAVFAKDWKTDSLTILSQTEEELVVEMDFVGNYEETGREKLTLKKTADGLRIDSNVF